MSDPALPVLSRPILRVRYHVVALLAILGLAAILRAYHLGTTSLWTDELFTRYYPRLGLPFMWGEGLRLEPTPPLYNSLIALWTPLAGDGPIALRLPSVAGSMASVVLVWLLARELFTRTTSAVLATLLLALSATSIFYAQEARSYALQGAAIGLAMLGFARFLRDPRQHGALVFYGVGALLAIYLHLTSALAVAAINLAALSAVIGRTRLLDRAGFLRWCAANAVVALACAPLVPVLLSPMTAGATSWIEPITRWSVERVLGTTIFGPALMERALAWGEIAFVALAALLLLPPWRSGRRALTVLILVPGLFLALMIGASLKKPVLLTRTLAWLWIPLALVLGDVLARRFRALAAAAVVLACIGTALHLRDIDLLKEDWQGFLKRLPGLAPPALVVLAPHTPPTALADYAPGAGHPVRLNGDFPPIVETTTIPAMLGTETIEPETMRAAIASGRPVWLIVRRPDYEWMRQAVAALPPPRETVQDVEGSNPALRALRW